MQICFDSRNEKYKRPFGAVKGGTEIFLRIGISNDIIVRNAWGVIKYDCHDEPAWYVMHRVSDDDIDFGTDAYSCAVTINDTGLYWYHFVIETDLGILKVLRSESDDSVIIIDEGTSGTSFAGSTGEWQLTVYNRKYEEPEWIYGGVYYHIFVDRFYRGGASDHRSNSQACSVQGLPVAVHNNESGQELPKKIYRDDWGGEPHFLPDENGKVWNNDFFGGNIAGVTEKLPYLADLGVTCIYLSPVFRAYSNHKYDTANYMEIDPDFGTEDDLKVLCSQAKERDIRVILDGVFAHTGADSIYFNKYGTYGEGGAWRDDDSPYRPWYMFGTDGSYDSWWGIETLPKVNKNEPSYVEYITGENGVARKWLAAGASGWRLDVADELPVSFMTKLSEAVREEKSNALLIGEVWEDASSKSAYNERKNYFEGDKLDSVMNYPLKDAIIDFLRNGNAQGLAITVERIMENYPPFAVNALMNNLGTHDSIRILTALTGEKIEPYLETRAQQARTQLTEEEYKAGISLLKAAVVLQMTLPGVPCIYYADEVGMEGYADPFNRKCYPWGSENHEILDWYKRIIKIRKGCSVFARGGYRTIRADDGVYIFSRLNDSGIDDGEVTVTIDLAEMHVFIEAREKGVILDEDL